DGANGVSTTGGGGGGRVALYYQTLEGFSESSISASAGLRGSAGYKHGVPGTLYFEHGIESKLVLRGTPNNLDAQIEVDSLSDGHSLLVETMSLQLDFRNHQFAHIELKNNGVLTVFPAENNSSQGITLAADNISIDVSSKIDVTGKGLLGDLASGIYTGGSHGGRGGDYSSNNVSGASYGNYQQPVTLGRGGRTKGTGTDARGGGAIEMGAAASEVGGGTLGN